MSIAQLEELGVRAGLGTRVSVDARLFGGERIVIGRNVRIDAFCVLTSGTSGFINIGSHIHVSSGARLFGQGGISLGDFSIVSVGSTLLSASDDFSGDYLVGPLFDETYTNVTEETIELGTYAAIGANSVVLPGVHLNEGAVLGACSMATASLDPWTIYAGTPARPLRQRNRDIAVKAAQFSASYERSGDR